MFQRSNIYLLFLSWIYISFIMQREYITAIQHLRRCIVRDGTEEMLELYDKDLETIVHCYVEGLGDIVEHYSFELYKSSTSRHDTQDKEFPDRQDHTEDEFE